MTMSSLKESLISQVGETPQDRILSRNLLSPQRAFSSLEAKVKAITLKSDHLRPLYESRVSHTAALRAYYPLFLNDKLGSKEAIPDTEKLFKSHKVEFNDKNYEVVVSAVLDYVAGLSDKELSVIKGTGPKWPE